MKYIISIDQSTQGTKALLLDENGKVVKRRDRKHRQLISEEGYVSHDALEIYGNTVGVVKDLIEVTGIDTRDVKAIGISNQRETTVLWDEKGKPLADAVVWQCNRAKDIAEDYQEYAEEIYNISGLPLSPYFPACKMKWLIDHCKPQGKFFFGTIDTWLVYKLTGNYKTDATNASRTQLFDIHEGVWSTYLLDLFGIPMEALPEVVDSNSNFGSTDFDGLLAEPVPILTVLGDSHAALYGQGCHSKGQVKTTLGTGSSIMMNIGREYQKSKNGLATSLAWKIDGVTEYVFEGNINYAGAVITWLSEDLKMIHSISDLEPACREANPEDSTVLVPAFSGLSAPYWDNDAKAMFYGMSRTTGRNEIIKATVESIAYQITDVLNAMASDSGLNIDKVKTDGGPSNNTYLMQFLSNMVRTNVCVSSQEELSAIGVGYLAGITCGLYDKEEIFSHMEYRTYQRQMDTEHWKICMDRWYDAIHTLLGK